MKLNTLWALVGLFMSGTALASVSLELPLPDDVRVVYESQAEAPDYLLVLGTYRRINNEWRIQNDHRVTGLLLSQTLEFPRNSSERAVYVQLRDSLPAERRRELFSCQGLLCGSSNAWANAHFKRATLYGIDANQSYGVYETLTEKGQRVITVIYTVRRGNGSVYAQLERIKVLGQTEQPLVTPPDSIANALAETGAFIVPLAVSQGEQRVSGEQAQALVQFLNQHKAQKHVLVGHWDAAGADSVVKSEQLAAQALADLKARGLRAEVDVFGVGNRAPAGREALPGRVILVRN